MKLFINAGGKGKRLRPITRDIPKPMVEVAGIPVLEHLLNWAKDNGIRDIVMMEGYMAEAILNYFGDGRDFGVNITHSVESQPLGSGGALKLASKYVEGRFAYISGDHICEVDLNRMNSFHEKNNSDLTALVHESSHPEDSDILQVDESYRVVRFISKDESHEGVGNLSNSGLCIVEPKVLGVLDQDVFDLEGNLYPKVISNGMNFFAYKTEEFMADMGTPERLKKCEEHLTK